MEAAGEFNSHTEKIDFREFLRNELIRRCHRNKGYSLRAFSRQVGMSHATLSSLISGKRSLTRNSVIKLCRSLKLSQEQTNQYLEPFDAGTEISTTDHQNLALDVFTAISDWYHDAILELTHIKNFKPEIRWISNTLGISTAEAKAAVERLERLELLEISNCKWIDRSRNNTTNINNSLSSAALRQLQAKVLQLSLEALETLPRTERDHTSITIAMQASDLDEVKERIRKFRYELVTFIERKSAKPESVYQFAFSVFPLTKNKTL